MKKKLISLVLIATMALSMVACGGKKAESTASTEIDAVELPADGNYTFRSYTSMVSTWSPTDWQVNSEGEIITLTTSPLFDYIADEDSDTGYKVICDFATDFPTDVTSEYAGNETYGVSTDATEGVAWRVSIRDDGKWEDGTGITTADFDYTFRQFLNKDMQNYRASQYYSGQSSLANAETYYGGETEWENVGFKIVDDYTFDIILSNPVSAFDFQYAFSAIYLLNEELYEANKEETGDIIKSSYGTAPEKYSSFGPYKVVSYQPDKSLRLEKNDQWYGWTDGNHEGQYMTTAVDYSFVTEHTTLLSMFLQGKLDWVGLTSTDMEQYGTSDYVYFMPDSYTYYLDFNTDMDSLKSRESDNVNKTMLAYPKFLEAVSLSYDRKDFCSSCTAASVPAYGLLNDQYVVDPENWSLYRDSKAAQKVLCDTYGTTSVDDITGYNVDAATKCLQEAYDACYADGNIDDDDIVTIDYHVASAEARIQKQVDFLQDALDAAATGTSLEGRIKVELVADEDYYNSMVQGTADLIQMAWGGMTLDPFGMMEIWTDPVYAAYDYGFDVTQELTLTIAGEEKTMSLTDWFNALVTDYATADIEVRTEIVAGIEGAVLTSYHDVPFCSLRTAELWSQRVVRGSEEYVNSLVQYGGLRTMTYTMTDEMWEDYCAEQNNQLTY